MFTNKVGKLQRKRNAQVAMRKNKAKSKAEKQKNRKKSKITSKGVGANVTCTRLLLARKTINIHLREFLYVCNAYLPHTTGCELIWVYFNPEVLQK